MPSRTTREPRSFDVEIDLDGETFKGSYTVERGTVKVHLLGAGSKATQVGNFPPKVTAEMLLGQLALTLMATRRPRPSGQLRD